MTDSMSDCTILCLSHLRWETTLFQRPQQLMIQFDAMGIPVRYLAQWSARRHVQALLGREETRGRTGKNLLWRNVPFVPRANSSRLMGFLNDLHFRRHIRQVAGVEGGDERPRLLWLYHPRLHPIASPIDHDLLVYDCMDPFQAFRGEKNKATLVDHERRLLEAADIVFTGGRSLQAAREGINPRSFCYPSGIDLPHFMKALEWEGPLPGDVADLPRPILGYWGAVDERVDFDLLAALCERMPEASVVLLGPLIDMERPPIEPSNFHWLGRKEYAELPAYLAAFDLCLLPFAVTPLTTSMSPTKTPEYLAGGRPVVSTPLPDVEETWGDVVSIAGDPEVFVGAVRRALKRPRPDRGLVEAARSRAVTWEDIAGDMRRRIEEVIAEKKRWAMSNRQ